MFSIFSFLLWTSCVSQDQKIGLEEQQSINIRLEQAPKETQRLDVDLDEVRTDYQKLLQGTESAYIQLDRTMYLPGETIWARLWWVDGANKKTFSPDQSLTYGIHDSTGKVIRKIQVREAPSIAVNIPISANMKGGMYTLSVYEDQYKPIAKRDFFVNLAQPPKIRKKLSFLRETYGKGEEVVASISVQGTKEDAFQDHPIEAHIEVDGTKFSTVQLQTDDKGEAQIRFRLPENLATGEGILTILVRDGALTESISRRIPIVLEEVRLGLYPEGGALVHGIQSRVYFEALDQYDKPVSISGALYDKHKKIADISSVHDGLGRFQFTPQKGHAYHIQLNQPAGIDTQYPLPDVQDKGCVLRNYDDFDTEKPFLRVSVRCNKPTPVTVVHHKDGTIHDIASVQTPAVVHLKELDERQGVTTLTVLGDTNIPIAERLVYRNRMNELKVTLSTENTSYSLRDSASLYVRTTDHNDKPVSAELAVSVVDDTLLRYADDKQGNIASKLYLESYFQKEIEDPLWYFSKEEPLAGLGLDLLMGTKGWRGYVFKTNEDAGEGGKVKLHEGISPYVRHSTLRGKQHQSATRTYGTSTNPSQRDVFHASFGRRIKKPKGKSIVSVQFKSPIILGALDKNVIEFVIEGETTRWEDCYQDAPFDEAEIRVKFVISQDGSVSKASINSSTLGEDGDLVHGCLIHNLKELIFPSPKGGGIVIVKYPLLFSKSEVFQKGSGARLRSRTAPFPVPDYNEESPKERFDFRNTIYWNPSLHTDEKGEATVSFPISDSLTTFRARAEGIGDGLVGQGSHTFSSQLPFGISVHIPEHVSSGDQITLPITLYNDKEKSIDVSLEVDFGALTIIQAPSDQQILEAHSKKTVWYHLSIPEQIDSYDIGVKAQADGEQDVFRHTLFAHNPQFLQKTHESGVVRDSYVYTFDLENALDPRLSTDVVLSPIHQLLSGLDGMMRSPHGCFEQMSSANYPNILILQMLQKHQRSDAKIMEKAKKHLEEGYNKIQSFTHKDGGFGMYEGKPASAFLTAYGIAQLHDMKSVWPVDQDIITRAQNWLWKQRDGKGGYKTNKGNPIQNAYTTYSLAQSQTPGFEAEIEYQAQRAKNTQDSYELALATLTLIHSDRTQEAKEAAHRLIALQQKGSYWTTEQTATYSGQYGRNIETTALTLMAFMHLDMARETTQESLFWMLKQKRGKLWESTQSTILALKALVMYSERFESSMLPKGTLTFILNGNEIASHDYDENRLKPVYTQIKNGFVQGSNTLEIQNTGEDVLPYSLQLSYFTDSPQNLQDNGFSLDVSFSKSSLSMGETTRMRAHIHNEKHILLRNPLVRIGIPAGLTPQSWQLQELLDRKTVGKVEHTKQEIILYVNTLDQDESKTIALDLVAAIPGTYSSIPSRAYPYYDQSSTVWNKGHTVEITP